MSEFSLNINGKQRIVNVDGDTPLLWVIRDTLGYTGTKFGCGRGLCGACTIHLDGDATRSCVTSIDMVEDNSEITTIEGLSEDNPHPIQQAWLEEDVPQCGYCQSGMMMAAASLLDKTPDATDEDIDNQITNICRCGTFQRDRQSIHLAKTKIA